MHKISDFKKSTYKTGEIRALFGNVTQQTIRNWERSGKIKMTISSTGRRYMTREDLIAYLESIGQIYNDIDEISKRDVIYARVSSHEQKKSGDLDRQAMYLVESVPDLLNPLILKEVGSGMNDTRKNLVKLINMVMADEVRNVYITYKDRLSRHCFNYLKVVFEAKGVNIIVLKDEKAVKSVEQELAEDLISMISTFTGRLHGLRSGKNKKKLKENENV